MSINITSDGRLSTNPALDVKAPELKPSVEPRKRDASGRFASKEAKVQNPAKDYFNALVGGAPYLYSIIKQNKILSDACKYNQLADAVYLGRDCDSYYLFKFSKGSASGTLFGFHYNCGNLEEVVSHAEAIEMLRNMQHYDNIQKFTF